MKRLIVNADDFGLCRGANLGILHAHTQGIVTSATLMVSMPGAAEAFALAKATPTLGVGLHVTLTAGTPLAQGVDSLTSPDGRFLKLQALAAGARPGHLEREIRAQVAAFLAQGLKPTHLDSHHHVHLQIPAVGEILRQVAAELSVPVRGHQAALLDGFYGREQITPEWLAGALATLAGGTAELMCHPAYLDPWLLRNSSYNVERVTELETLTSAPVREAIAAHSIRLVNYRDPWEG